jgi:hypothetical protein
MAKIDRFVAKIFGSAAGVNQIAKFGSLFAGSSAFTTDAAQAQSLSNWLTGWLGAAIGGNSPAIEDMNAAFFVLSTQIAYILQAGLAEWNTDTVYYIGSLANDGAGVTYKSLTDANQGNALSDLTNWRRVGGQVRVNAKSANYTVTPNDALVPGNAGAGAITLTLPACSEVGGIPFYFSKVDSSGNAVTLLCQGADTILDTVPGSSSIGLTTPGQSVILISDGVGSYLVF